MRQEVLKRMRTVLTAAVTAVLLCAAFASADSVPAFTAESDIGHINQYGNIELLRDGKIIPPEEIREAGFDYGDVVTVTFLDQSIDMPIVNDYSEVESGVSVLCIKEDKAVLAKNGDDFASAYIADRNSLEDEDFEWKYKKGVKEPLAFTVTMKNKGGFYAEFGSSQLKYTDKRSDYPDLTDEEFANFRVIITTGMGRNILYRTSSPVDPEHGRNTYADAALKRAGVKTVMNMANLESAVKESPGYEGSYYSTIDSIALNMGVNMYSEDFRNKLAEGLRFFASHEGPYAIHCQEGKDRAGVAAALLECFMGAGLDEVMNDYMLSYYNYFGITPDDEQYYSIREKNIEHYLRELFGVDDLRKADLAAEAEEYFRETGLSDAEMEALRANLSESYTSPLEIILTIAFGIAVIVAAYCFATRHGRR